MGEAGRQPVSTAELMRRGSRSAPARFYDEVSQQHSGDGLWRGVADRTRGCSSDADVADADDAAVDGVEAGLLAVHLNFHVETIGRSF